jgi:Flp pilus assembly pilin Flp
VSAHPSKSIQDLSARVLADYALALPKQVEQRAKRHCALSLKRQAGQGMTEYIIIVALVAVAAIAVYQYLGQVLRAQTAAVAKELAGEDGTQQSRAAQSAAESAATQAAAKSLKDFTGQAQGSSR